MPRHYDYNERFLGATLENGDASTGFILYEGGRRWFVVKDASGNEYETQEMPCIRIDLTGNATLRCVRS